VNKEEIVEIETNIDDMNPEIYSYLMDQLFDLGAVDVYFTPIQMKKNRPGVKLAVLSPPEKENVIIKKILTETTTLGVRLARKKRVTLDREVAEIETELGKAKIKLAKLDGEIIDLSPEYESCSRLAAGRNIPLLKIYNHVRSEAKKNYGLD